MSKSGNGVASNSISGDSPPKNTDINSDLKDSERGTKRDLTFSDGSTPPGQGREKITDTTNSSQKVREAKSLSSFIKPLYPTVQDRKGVEDASEYGTRVKIVGVELPDSKKSPYDKVLHEELWDQLVKQKAQLAAATIIHSLNSGVRPER